MKLNGYQIVSEAVSVQEKLNLPVPVRKLVKFLDPRRNKEALERAKELRARGNWRRPLVPGARVKGPVMPEWVPGMGKFGYA